MLYRVSVVLVVLGLIAVVTPPALGYVYERQVRSEFDSGLSNPAFTVELSEYERGLFTSKATLRMAYSERFVERFRNLPATDATGAPLDTDSQAAVDGFAAFLDGEIRYDVDIRHGPLLTDDGVRLALASLRAELDTSSGALAEIRQQAGVPYLMRIDGIVNFDNIVDFRAFVPPIGWKGTDDSTLAFSGFTASGSYDASTRNLIGSGLTDTLEFQSEAGAVRLGGIGLDFDARMISDYFWLGQSSFAIESLEAFAAAAAGNGPVLMKDLGVGFDIHGNDAGDKVSMAVSYEISSLSGVQGLELKDMELAIKLTDIDLEAIEAYAELNQRMVLATPDELAALLPEFEELAVRMLQGSPGFSVGIARFTLNNQPFVANAGIDFDASALPYDLDAAVLKANPVSLVGGVSAQGQLEAAEPLARLMATSVMQGQIRSSLAADAEIDEAQLQAIAAQQGSMLLDGLITQGLVDRDRGTLSTNFRFNDGVLLVNGKPVPLGG